MSNLAHSLLALVDASKNDLKCSLTNYIDFTVENQFGKLRNRIVSMIESGVLGDDNALLSAQANTTQVNSSNQQITPNALSSESLGSIIATEPNNHRIKQEWLDSSSSSINLMNGDCNDALNDDDEDVGEYLSDFAECEDCVKGICGLDGENDNNCLYASTGVDTENGLNQGAQPNGSLASGDLTVIPNAIDDSKLSADNTNDIINNYQSNNIAVSTSTSTQPQDDDSAEELEEDFNADDEDNSNTSNTLSSMFYSNGQLISDQITLPPNNDFINHGSDDDETAEQIEINQDDEELRRLENVQRVDTTQAASGQPQVNEQGTFEAQPNETFQSVRPGIEHTNQQSAPSTSGQRSSGRKRIQRKMFSVDQSTGEVKNDKRKSKSKSSKAVKKVKLEEIGQEEEENEKAKHQFVILKLNCTEPGCRKILKSFEMWKEHLSSIHGKMPFKQLEDTVRHNQHGQTEYPCTECEAVLTSQDSLKQHWTYSHQSGKFQCLACAFVANFRSEVQRHYRNNHRSRKYQCTFEGCEQVLRNNYELERHERIHSGERPFMCLWANCQVTFNQLSSATNHVRRVHFHLPRTVREQNELNIIDDRDPKLYVQVS